MLLPNPQINAQPFIIESYNTALTAPVRACSCTKARKCISNWSMGRDQLSKPQWCANTRAVCADVHSHTSVHALEKDAPQLLIQDLRYLEFALSPNGCLVFQPGGQL